VSVLVQLDCGLDAEGLRSEYPHFPLEIGPLRFVNDDALGADWLVATLDIGHSMATRVPRARRILILTEPDTDLAADYVNQFGILVAPQFIAGFSGIWHQGHGALPNRFARDVTKAGFAFAYTYDELVALQPPEKRDAVAVVLSRKSLLPGHRQRLRFVRRLKETLGDRLDVFGDGHRKIGLKADAILPYKYHLALENTVMPSYWTEKVADAYLGFALPFVSGPPDLARWFPEDSFVPIDLDHSDKAIETVVAGIEGGIYSGRLPAIIEARNRVLRDERLCPMIARVIAVCPNAAPRLDEVQTVLPAPKRPPMARIAREIRRIYGRLDVALRP
jgi:hypothetical protein